MPEWLIEEVKQDPFFPTSRTRHIGSANIRYDLIPILAGLTDRSSSCNALLVWHLRSDPVFVVGSRYL